MLYTEKPFVLADDAVCCEPFSESVNRLTLERRLTGRRLTERPGIRNNVLFGRTHRTRLLISVVLLMGCFRTPKPHGRRWGHCICRVSETIA